MKKINDKKEKLKVLAMKTEFVDKGAVINLLDDNCLDLVINNITSEKVKLKTNSLVKKGYFTADEQFISLISEFVFYFRMNLPTIIHTNLCITDLFKTQCPLVLLGKKYYHENFEDYQKEFRRLIVSNMFFNIMSLYDNYDSKMWKKFNIRKDMNINDYDDVDTLFNFMKLLAWSNINEYAVLKLFTNINADMMRMPEGAEYSHEEFIKTVIELYYTHYNIMINNCLKKYKSIKNLVNDID